MKKILTLLTLSISLAFGSGDNTEKRRFPRPINTRAPESRKEAEALGKKLANHLSPSKNHPKTHTTNNLIVFKWVYPDESKFNSFCKEYFRDPIVSAYLSGEAATPDLPKFDPAWAYNGENIPLFTNYRNVKMAGQHALALHASYESVILLKNLFE